MSIIGLYTRFGYVEGLGDEEIPWWIAPYVRDFAGLARSSAVLEATRVSSNPMPGLVSLTANITQIAAVARVAAFMEGGKQLSGGVSGALRAELDEYCGTPPRPHHLNQAALAVSLIAAGLHEKDPAKAVLVAEVERLQQKVGAAGGSR